MPDNKKLAELVAPYAKRSVGRPGKQPVIKYASFQYRAGSWEKERRIVAKIEHHQGEMFPRIGYIATSLKWNNKAVVKFYNHRGTCEQWIKEGKYALNWIRLSCQGFKENEIRLKLFIMAYNLGNIFRTLALPEKIKSWSLRTIQLKLVKMGGRFIRRSLPTLKLRQVNFSEGGLIRHARYYYLLLAEATINEHLWKSIMQKIRGLPLTPRLRRINCPVPG